MVLGVDVGASDGRVGVVAEGAWFGSRGGSVEAARAARRGVAVVGGTGLWGWGGVVAGLVGTAGAARGGKSATVSLIQCDDQPFVFCVHGVVVVARCSSVGFATLDAPDLEGEPIWHP